MGMTLPVTNRFCSVLRMALPVTENVCSVLVTIFPRTEQTFPLTGSAILKTEQIFFEQLISYIRYFPSRTHNTQTPDFLFEKLP